MNLDAPGRNGLFRVDDLVANAKYSPVERLRRAQFLQRTYTALGRGLYAMREADKEGKLRRIFSTAWRSTPDAPKRRPHFPLRTDERSLPVNGLPSGYAVFQAPRPRDDTEDVVTGATMRPKGKAFDLYIHGLARIEFRSVVEFIPHLYWLRSGRSGACLCWHCA